MSDIFLQILNMSLGAAYVIVAVIILRFLLKKAPKILSYSLWAVVFFRLVCPFSIESALSLFKMNPKPIANDIVYSELPTINTQIDIVDKAINPVLATQAPALVPVASINPMQVVVAIGTFVWVFGMAIMLVYSIISLLILKKRLVGAVRLEGNIWLCDGIKSPFVLGLFRPQIYLPSSLDEVDRRYILMHEQNHIRRLDHVVKIVGFAALCLHWFNPLVWVAFFLFVKDMEMSCDEKVLKTLDGDVRGEYSALLLNLATGKRIVAGSPLAFGEGDTKSRIKNVMSYKKPAFWVVIVGVIAVVGIAVGLMLNPVSNTEKTVELSDIGGMNIGAEMPRIVCGDEHRVVMQGTFGLIVYDIDGEEITDRITYDELNKIGIEFLITAASEDGKTVYLSDKSAPFTHKYDVESGKIDKFNGEVDATFQTEAISAGNSLYDEYFDLTYLIGENIIKTSDGFIYLRASRYWQMKSLELIICPFDREKSKIIMIFGDFEKETFAPTTTPSLKTTSPATTSEAEISTNYLIKGALNEELNLSDAATIKVKNSDSTAWEEASLETLINSDNADFIAEFDGWCYGMTEDGNAVKVSVGDSFDGFKVSKATASIKFQAGENSDEKTVYIMRSEFVLGGFYRLNGELNKPVDGYSVGELVFSTNKNNLQNMPEPITDYAFNNGLTEDDGRVYFDLGPPDDYNIDFSAVPDNGEVIAVVAELTDITFRAVDMKEAGNSAKFAGFADESVSTEIIQYPDVPEDVQTLFNQGGRTVTGLLGKL